MTHSLSDKTRGSFRDNVNRKIAQMEQCSPKLTFLCVSLFPFIVKQVYSALLGDQIENAISIEDGYSPSLYAEVRPYIIAMPIIQGVAVLVLAYFTYLLFRDFGWEVLHLIGADRKLKVGFICMVHSF